MYIKKIICAVLSLFLILVPNLVFASSNSDDIIKFADSTIEAETRRLLKKEIGDITKTEVLKITDFGSIEIGERYFISAFENPTITTLTDLKWFKNLKTLDLYNCKLESLEGIEGLTKLEKLDISYNNLKSIEEVSNFKSLVSFYCNNNNNLADISPIKDLINLEDLRIDDSSIADLIPLKNLTKLKYLDADNSKITDVSTLSNLINLVEIDISGNNLNDDITPLKNLTKLKYVNASNSKITNISILSNMINLEGISISGNKISDGLTQIRNLTKLRFLYDENSEITNISVLSNLKNLEGVDLSYNKISDVSPLKDLEKLTYLDLSYNNITDLMPIKKLSKIRISLYSNPISDDMLNKFYAPSESDYFTKTFKEKININKPEFAFDLLAYYNNNPSVQAFSVESITITDTSNNKVIQKISIPELTTNGRTEFHTDNYSTTDPGNLGFELVDVNFDGYKDIRLYDTQKIYNIPDSYNASYLKVWIYLVWNQNKGIYELNNKFNDIPNIVFDEKNKLIYGNVKSSYYNNYYTTYKYVNNSFVPIQYRSKEYIGFSNDKVAKYLEMFSVKVDLKNGLGYHEVVYDKDKKTGENKIVSDEYVFYSHDDAVYSNDNDKEIARYGANSEVGKLLDKIHFYLSI